MQLHRNLHLISVSFVIISVYLMVREFEAVTYTSNSLQNS